jgi:hypothetical protein
MAYEILGIVADIFPVTFVEYNFSSTALVDEVLKVLASKRRVTAK